MRPRVFISSTYYDLKYLRESLEKFLYNLNFEPVLFEANKVTFEHGKPLDISCFNEVKTCHMMVLIIGGRYGSIISDQESDIEKEIYDKEYISITRKEYETALKDNIPVFICIDKNVYGEYNTYKINREFYDNAIAEAKFKFFHVDGINVFKFIDLVSTKAIKTFEKIEEIEFYLKDQISGMFYLYLESLKSKDRQDEIFDAVKELKSLTSNMNEIVKEVGKKIIEPDTYQEIIDAQYDTLLKYLFEDFSTYVNVDFSMAEVDNRLLDRLTDFFLRRILTDEFRKSLAYTAIYKKWGDYLVAKEREIDKMNVEFNAILPGFRINAQISKLISDYFNKIKPLITLPSQEQLLKDKLKEAIRASDLPF